MRFIGHLDLMRFFQKMLRRSGLPVKFTEGMSPHMIMSFASPLGLGLTSEGEYVDIELTEDVKTQQIVDDLNLVTIDGIEILAAAKIGEGRAQNAMALLARASYLVGFKEESAAPEGWAERIEGFLAQEKIEVLKQSKKGEKLVDIRPLIIDMHKAQDQIEMLLTSGSAQNLKPELVMDAFAAYLGTSIQPFSLSVCRLDMFAEGADGNYPSLLALGEEVL